ncbi:MAG: SLC13 family permease [Acidobacteriota bacterium]|nr:SLC13 family permease [Blastocatellia bacterium]MDW8241296.1 SLC13 family permease [Acidobacteriota bacterium]
MNFETLFVIAVLLLAVVLFVTEKLSVDLVSLLVMALLLLSGIITPAEGLSGFSNAATITVGAMFVLSAGLFRTGAVNSLGVFVSQVFQKNFLIAMLAVMVLVGLLSAFINNTPVIAIFLPILLGVAKEMHISASKILMPISFASMFGGVCTLIGTSTNILVSSIAESHGLAPFSMFELTPLGLIMFIVGATYMLLVGIRLIPNRRGEGDLTEAFSLNEYLTEIVLLPDGPSVGQPIKDTPLVHDLDITIVQIRRDSVVIHQPTGDVPLRAGDVLLVRCNLEKIRALQEREGIKLKPEAKWDDEHLMSDEYRLLEVVVAPNSPLVGSTLQRSNFRENYGGTVLAIRHHQQLLREKISDTVLRAGDVLLVAIHRARLNAFKRSGHFITVSEQQTVEFRRDKSIVAVAIVFGVVLAATVKLSPIVVAAVSGAILLVLLGCLTMEEAYQAIEWRILFLLAGVLSLGTALEKTGAAQLISSYLVSTVGDLGLVALVSAFYLLTSLLTETMSNNATAALLAPIAISTAAALDVNPRPFLMAITFAASASFMTPVGYQTNTMIYGPGQYKFIDFVKVGGPLNLLFWLLATLLIPLIWPF